MFKFIANFLVGFSGALKDGVYKSPYTGESYSSFDMMMMNVCRKWKGRVEPLVTSEAIRLSAESGELTNKQMACLIKEKKLDWCYVPMDQLDDVRDEFINWGQPNKIHFEYSEWSPIIRKYDELVDKEIEAEKRFKEQQNSK